MHKLLAILHQLEVDTLDDETFAKLKSEFLALLNEHFKESTTDVKLLIQQCSPTLLELMD